MQTRARTPEARAHKKEKILESAQELFFANGYESTTVERIMQNAGLSTGTFYLYFKSKTEIYKTILNQGLEILDGMFAKAIEEQTGNAQEKVHSLTRTYLTFYQNHREYFDIIAVINVGSQELKERDSEISRIIEEKSIQMLKRIEDVIQHGIEAGQFRAQANAWLLALSLWSMMDGMVILATRRNLEPSGVTLPQLIEAALENFFQGIIAR